MKEPDDSDKKEQIGVMCEDFIELFKVFDKVRKPNSYASTLLLIKRHFEAVDANYSFAAFVSENNYGKQKSFIDKLVELKLRPVWSCLFNMLSQDEIAEIINNPLASDRAKQYARYYKLPDLAQFETSKLLSANVCDSIFSEFNLEKIVCYYLAVKERNVISQHLCTLLRLNRIPLFYVLGAGYPDLAREYLYRMRELLNDTNVELDKKIVVKKLMVKNSKHLLRMACRIGDVPLLEELSKTLSIYSAFNELNQPILLEPVVSIPRQFLVSPSPAGVLPVHIAIWRNNCTLADFLLKNYLRVTPVHDDTLLKTIIGRNGLFLVHCNILHLICQLDDEIALNFAQVLHNHYGKSLIDKFNDLDFISNRPLDYLSSKETQQRWIEKFNLEQPKCQRVVVIDIDETMIVNGRNRHLKLHTNFKRDKKFAYLYPEFFSALFRYAKFKGVHIYIVTLSKRESFELGKLLAKILESDLPTAMSYVNGYFCKFTRKYPEYLSFLQETGHKPQKDDKRKHLHAEYLATKAGLDPKQIEFCMLEDLEKITQAAIAHGQKAITAKTEQGDPTCILEMANFCGLANEKIEDYDPADPIVAVINTLRMIGGVSNKLEKGASLKLM